MSGLLVVDGGQSAVRIRVSESSSAPSTVVELPGVTRLDEPLRAVPQAVADAVEHLQHPSLDRVVLGLTTAPTDPASLAALASRVADVTGAGEIWLADDTVTAHAAALAGLAGVALWVGTGVACLAVRAEGEPRLRTFDGHGFLLGDHGGAFAIGRDALALVLRDADLGRPPHGVLPGLAEARFGDLTEAPVVLHDSPTRIHDVAQFARDVLAVADEDDRADAVVTAAADELARTVEAATAWAGPDVPVVVGGGMLTEAPALRERLTTALGARPTAALDGPPTAALDAPLTAATRSAIHGAEWLGHQPTPGVYREGVYVWRRGPVA